MENTKKGVSRPPPAEIGGRNRCRKCLRVAPPPSGKGIINTIISTFINIIINISSTPLYLLANMMCNAIYHLPMIFCISMSLFE